MGRREWSSLISTILENIVRPVHKWVLGFEKGWSDAVLSTSVFYFLLFPDLHCSSRHLATLKALFALSSSLNDDANFFSSRLKVFLSLDVFFLNPFISISVRPSYWPVINPITDPIGWRASSDAREPPFFLILYQILCFPVSIHLKWSSFLNCVRYVPNC